MPFVIKFGGSVFGPEQRDSAACAVFDAVAGHQDEIALVHGGGTAISASLAAAGVPSRFVDGVRETSHDAMPLVERALEAVNEAIVARLRLRGVRAIGIDGRDGLFFSCSPATTISGARLGRVGAVAGVDLARMRSLWGDGVMPVVAPLGMLHDGGTCNVNADDLAAALAGALRVPLIVVTDVPGVRIGGYIQRLLRTADIADAVRSGDIRGGMIAKTRACAQAVERGAPYASIVPAGSGIFNGAGTRIGA